MKITISLGGEQWDPELLVVVGNSGVENYKLGWRTVGVRTISGGGEQV